MERPSNDKNELYEILLSLKTIVTIRQTRELQGILSYEICNNIRFNLPNLSLDRLSDLTYLEALVNYSKLKKL